MKESPKVAVLTFATISGEKPFKDYSYEVDRLRKSVTSFDLDFYSYSYSDLEKLISGTTFEKFPKFHRGVGGWFWKPMIILDFLKKYHYDFVIYLDVDCVLLKDPGNVIRNFIEDFDIAGFQQSSIIGDWTTRRVLKRTASVELMDSTMWTAGILVVKSSPDSVRYLNCWLEAMSDPFSLFELPFEKDGYLHRHDQSLLSILIAKNKIKIYDLGPGFYSEGIEKTSSCIDDAWVATGVNIGSTRLHASKEVSNRYLSSLNYRYRKLIKNIFWIYHCVDFFSRLRRDASDLDEQSDVL